jgi:hypothetical protein
VFEKLGLENGLIEGDTVRLGDRDVLGPSV